MQKVTAIIGYSNYWIHMFDVLVDNDGKTDVVHLGGIDKYYELNGNVTIYDKPQPKTVDTMVERANQILEEHGMYAGSDIFILDMENKYAPMRRY